MKHYVWRDFNRTPHDDFELNISPRLSHSLWATEIWVDGELLGWLIRPLYE